MSDRLPALSEVTTLADGDQVYVVDVSDTGDHASGSSARISLSNLAAAVRSSIGDTIPMLVTEEIETIELLTAGRFDFTSIPGTFDRLLLKGYMRGDINAGTDNVNVYFNTDYTTSNYHYQRHHVSNGAHSNTEDNLAVLGQAMGANAPTNSYAILDGMIEDYANAAFWKSARFESWGWSAASNARHQHHVVTNDQTSAITALRIAADGDSTDELIGKITLYGQRIANVTVFSEP